MTDPDISRLADQIQATLDKVGELDRWLLDHLHDDQQQPRITAAYRELTRRLLGGDRLGVAHWERLMVSSSAAAPRRGGDAGAAVCRAAIDELLDMIRTGAVQSLPAASIVTLASALTLVLAGQRGLRQPIEAATAELCDTFPDCLPDMAQRCQDLWQRHGQMSGAKGLYVWDTRHEQWRLRQDFKSNRPGHATHLP